MYKKYCVELSDEERQQLKKLLSTGSLSNAANRHVRILLKSDAAKGGPGWTDEQISEAFDVNIRTVMRVRQTFRQVGLERAIWRKKRSGTQLRKIDGEVEAHLVALVCSPPPAGQARWSLRLLSDRLVKLVELESLSHETVRQALKKTNLSLG